MSVVRVVSCALLFLAGCDRVFGFDIPGPTVDAADAPLPPEAWLSVDGGLVHACGIRRDHTLWCWGRNDSGQLGQGVLDGDREHPDPVQVGTAADWDRVSTGRESTCAIKRDHTLWCWGRNSNGQLGDGTATSRFEPVAVPGTYTFVSVGSTHTCAIDEEQGLRCWGQGVDGRRGDGSTGEVRTPTPIGGSWLEVDAGHSSTCALASDRTLWCWGSSANGRLGIGDGMPDQLVPVQVGTETWRTLAVGRDAACAIREDGRLRCWGSNNAGQLGDGTMQVRTTPAPVDQDQVTDWIAVGAGEAHACGIRGSGELTCWGDNRRGALGFDPSRTSRPIPTAIEIEGGTEQPWVTVGPGVHHTCAIDALGRLWCAGSTEAGAVGLGEGVRRSPVQIAGSWQRPVTGEDVTCASPRGRQEISCWGSNELGLLGDGSTADRQAPAPAGAKAWVTLDLGDHGCAIDEARHRWCWGANNLGQLGNGTTTSSTVPIEQLGTTAWSWISASRGHTCAITRAGALYCHGRNAERQTGRDAPTGDNSPTLSLSQVAGTWKQVTTGIDFSCGLRTDNKASCWGYHGWGSLGVTGVTQPTPVPQAVATTQTFDSLVSGARHTCALAGTNAQCWGWNPYGQLGDGSVITRATPVALPGTWSMLSLGEAHSCGIQPDGSLWCWGDNYYGQLGDGTTLDRIDPTRIGSDSDWESVAAGLRHTCATKTDGRLLCWGGNFAGALGDGAAWRGAFRLVER